MVPQEIILFDKDLYENVRYANRGASHESIMQSLEDAKLMGRIEKAPLRERLAVGRRGQKLSGGEKQRVAIARILLKNQAKIYFFDEATSALDLVTEAMITQKINQLADSGSTVVVVAHRLATIQDYEDIIVIDKGSIAERGTHRQLLSVQGLYANLWNEQRKHENNIDIDFTHEHKVPLSIDATIGYFMQPSKSMVNAYDNFVLEIAKMTIEKAKNLSRKIDFPDHQGIALATKMQKVFKSCINFMTCQRIATYLELAFLQSELELWFRRVIQAHVTNYFNHVDFGRNTEEEHFLADITLCLQVAKKLATQPSSLSKRQAILTESPLIVTDNDDSLEHNELAIVGEESKIDQMVPLLKSSH